MVKFVGEERVWGEGRIEWILEKVLFKRWGKEDLNLEEMEVDRSREEWCESS